MMIQYITTSSIHAKIILEQRFVCFLRFKSCAPCHRAYPLRIKDSNRKSFKRRKNTEPPALQMKDVAAQKVP